MRPRGKKAVKNAGSTKWGRRLKVLLASPVLAAAIAVGIPAYEDAHDHPHCTPTITQTVTKTQGPGGKTTQTIMKQTKQCPKP